MPKPLELTHSQLFACNALFTGFYKRFMEENRLLLSRLDAAGPLSADQQAILDDWARGLADLDKACEAQLMDIVMTHPSPGLH